MAYYQVTCVYDDGDTQLKAYYVVEASSPADALADLSLALEAGAPWPVAPDEEDALYPLAELLVRASAYDPLEDDEVPPRTVELSEGVRQVLD